MLDKVKAGNQTLAAMNEPNKEEGNPRRRRQISAQGSYRLTSTMMYWQMRRSADTLNVAISSSFLSDSMTDFYDEVTRRDVTAHLERRTRRKTALKLVNPLECQIAEAMYEGYPYQIACELDLTLQIIQNYQRILDSSLTHCKAQS
ncbi:hypothetical protein [uncultured Bifidobacterium sp.]|uniref:hypothetical protein n=1 Tax=uncultured Bifidobacterium sp. TaxID=165187 RepID=UPI0025934B38|nr:hypothetical protein [uncultured Bifidobacterium sp.]